MLKYQETEDQLKSTQSQLQYTQDSLDSTKAKLDETTSLFRREKVISGVYSASEKQMHHLASELVGSLDSSIQYSTGLHDKIDNSVISSRNVMRDVEINIGSLHDLSAKVYEETTSFKNGLVDSIEKIGAKVKDTSFQGDADIQSQIERVKGVMTSSIEQLLTESANGKARLDSLNSEQRISAQSALGMVCLYTLLISVAV